MRQICYFCTRLPVFGSDAQRGCARQAFRSRTGCERGRVVQVMCVVGGMMNSAQVRSATFGFGRGWETQIISSVVIGGTSMLGGIGTIWGTLVGVLFTGVISNGMTLLNVNEYLQYVINGALMFFAVMFNTYMTRKRI